MEDKFALAPSVITFHLNEGTHCITIAEAILSDRLKISVDPTFIRPGEAFHGVTYEDMARVGHGRLVFVADDQAAIVANDDCDVDADDEG